MYHAKYAMFLNKIGTYIQVPCLQNEQDWMPENPMTSLEIMYHKKPF